METRKVWSCWFQYIYFLRFSLFAVVFLPVLAALDWAKITSNITRAIFTLDSGWQAFYAAFFVIALHMTGLVTARNTVRNGEDRFTTLPPASLANTLRSSTPKTIWRVLIVSQIPSALVLLYLGKTAYSEGEQYKLLWVSTGNIWFFFLFGIVAAFVFWYLVSLFYYWTYRPSTSDAPLTPAALIFPDTMFGDLALAAPPTRLTEFLDRRTRGVLKISRPGYAKSCDGPLWELHFLSAVSALGVLLIYLFLYPLTAPVQRSGPTFYGHIMLCLGIAILSLVAISDAQSATADPKVQSRWARPVKRVFVSLIVVGVVIFLTALTYDHLTESVRLAWAFPTLGSIVVLVDFCVWFFAGAAFFLDRYRIPVITLGLALIFLPKISEPRLYSYLVAHQHPRVAQLFDSDHYFTVRQLPHAINLEQVLTPAKALDKRAGDPQDVYVIVTASGGGIRAAEWTSQVLASLETAFASDPAFHYSFHEHVLLASGVSGGSVGLLPFLLEYTAHDGKKPAIPFANIPTPNAAGQKEAEESTLADRITRPAACSSLEAVGWGLIYHDLFSLISPLRIPTSPAADSEPDRSWALAAAMNRNLHDRHCKTDAARFHVLPAILDGNGLTLVKSAEMLKDGLIPGFTFNTTVAETGSRFLLSNYWVPAPPSAQKPNVVSDFVPAESFLQVYSAAENVAPSSGFETALYADLPLATAARLSATFPIVSSGTRVPEAYSENAYHFLDGGYFDNDGTASAIEFLKSALGAEDAGAKGHPRKLKLLLLEIRDDDGQNVTTDSDDLQHQRKYGSPWTPLTQLTGIMQGLWNAGHVSIARRNRRDLCVLQQAFASQLRLRHIVFTIPTDENGVSPLSWNLTTGELRSITKRRNEIQDAIAETKAAVSEMRASGKNLPADSSECTAWVEPLQK